MEGRTGQTGREGEALAAFWDARLRAGTVADPHVRPGLRALLPGIARLRSRPAHGRRLALVLAGNTPLVGWPAVLFALADGWAVTVKRSGHERLWIDALADSVADVAPAWGARLALRDADHVGTSALVAGADAAIVYGSDDALAALRPLAPPAFLGFGHALSVAVATDAAPGAGLARDLLLHDQGGCLSPQALYATGGIGRFPDSLRRACAALAVPPRVDPGECRAVREARDLAWMDGCAVVGDDDLRWTLVIHPEPRPLPPPTGLCVLHVVPVARPREFADLLGPAAGRLSGVGVVGRVGDEVRAAARAAGASRICRAGSMQTPPLGWRNGGIDLPGWLRRAAG